MKSRRLRSSSQSSLSGAVNSLRARWTGEPNFHRNVEGGCSSQSMRGEANLKHKPFADRRHCAAGNPIGDVITLRQYWYKSP